MTTRQILNDVARCIRATAAPLLTVGVLTLARTAHASAPSSAVGDRLVLAAWWAAMIATLLWLLIAVIWAATRPLRDRRAFQELQRLREISTPADRALVHVRTTGWTSTAGEHVVVVNAATGATSRVWFPETSAPIGAFVVLERTDSGVKVVDWMNAHQVEAGHRHERRHAAHHITSRELGEDLPERDDPDDARQLIEETERFLKQQQ